MDLVHPGLSDRLLNLLNHFGRLALLLHLAAQAPFTLDLDLEVELLFQLVSLAICPALLLLVEQMILLKYLSHVELILLFLSLLPLLFGVNDSQAKLCHFERTLSTVLLLGLSDSLISLD